jgi:capsular polysaccharide biosynthesis protein
VDIWHQRFIVQAETWHVVDSTCSPYAEFVAGHWQFLESIPNHIEHAYIKRPQKFNRVEIKQAIYLLGRADENWYHLLLDTLPRYLQLKDIKQDVPVLVRSDLPETTISLIKSLISHKIIFVMPKDLVSVEKLFFVAARSTVHDSMPTNGEDQVKFSPQTIKELREWVLSRLHFENVLHLPKNIFIPRRSKYRNLINTDQARACLEAFDFVTVETNDDFYLKQHLYFNQANHIVSPGGAVLANIVFMNQGSRISLFRSWRDSDLLLWKKLADSCGVQFNEAIGIPTYYGSKTLARQHSNFFLPKRLIRKLLRL